MQNYTYYTVALTSPEHTENCPLLNDEGEVIGMIQPSAVANDTLSYAISALFADSLRISGIGFNDPVLQLTAIRKELPDDLQQANVAIYMVSTRNDTCDILYLRGDSLVLGSEGATRSYYRHTNKDDINKIARQKAEERLRRAMKN